MNQTPVPEAHDMLLDAQLQTAAVAQLGPNSDVSN